MCVSRSFTANEDNAGGTSVGAGADHTVTKFGTHRPRAAGREACADDRVHEGLPPGAGGAVCSLALCLFERVVDGNRESGMRLLREAMHCLCHPVEEEGFCLLLAAVAMGGGDQFLGLGNGHR